MDKLFKALGDPARHALLDSLRHKDGQTLSELHDQLEMTRFGVMKHLKVLEDAHLIITHKAGRFKYHYLNPVPLQEALDRWIEPLLAKPAAQGLTRLKSQLQGHKPMTAQPDLMLSTYINCSHDDLWDALTKGDLIAQYHFASTSIDGSFADGGQVKYLRADGTAMLTNTVTSITPKSKIEATFVLNFKEGTSPPPSHFVYMVEPTDAGMKLTVAHYNLGPGQEHTNDGWTRYLAGIKTYLEGGMPATGTPRFTPPGM